MQNTQSSNRTDVLFILISAFLSITLYIWAIYFSRPLFLANRAGDPLAEVHALSPVYYAGIIILVLAGIICLVRKPNKYVCLLVLLFLAVLLWLTPYLLTGFVRFSDSLWHMGNALRIDEIMSKNPQELEGYAWRYPASFVFHNSVVLMLGISLETYIGFFPLFCLLILVLLAYMVISRLRNNQIAFFSLFLVIPGLHYLQLHASPHALATILLFTFFALFLIKGLISKVAACLVLAGILFAHPVMPLVAVIFLASFLIVFFIRKRISLTVVSLVVVIILILPVWLLIYSNNPPSRVVTLPARPAQSESTAAQPPNPQSEIVVTQQPRLSSGKRAAELVDKIVPANMETGKNFLTGTPFIYEQIYSWNKTVYFVYGAGALCCILVLFITHKKSRRFSEWLSNAGGLQPAEIGLLVSIPFLIILIFLLAEQAHDLIETGLTFLIMVLSAIAASVIIRLNLTGKIVSRFLILGALLFFALTFPLITYSIDAYSSVPASEGNALKFMGERVELENRVIAGYALTVLFPYFPDNSDNIDLRDEELEFSGKPDLAVFRSTAYYYYAMRKNLSFENNRQIRNLRIIEEWKYSRIYTSISTRLYLKSE